MRTCLLVFILLIASLCSAQPVEDDASPSTEAPYAPIWTRQFGTETQDAGEAVAVDSERRG
jgi:hypothetical protein